MFDKKFYIILIFLLLLSSCVSQRKGSRPKTIRFIDSKGKETFLQRRVPKFNKEQMTKQKMSDPNIMIMNGNVDYNQNNLPQELFADKPSQDNQISYDVQTTDNTDEFIFKTTKEEEKLKQNLNQKKTEDNTKSNFKQTSKKTVVSPQETNGTFYIQIGAYKSKENAYEGLKKYSSIGQGLVKSYKSRQGNLVYRTLLGPYNSRLKAEQDLEKVIQKGHYDVYITRK